MLGLSKRMKEMCTSINELSQMSKTGKSNHQMLTHAMTEFSSVERGSMTTSTYLHSACTYTETQKKRITGFMVAGHFFILEVS